MTSVKVAERMAGHRRSLSDSQRMTRMLNSSSIQAIRTSTDDPVPAEIRELQSEFWQEMQINSEISENILSEISG
ncbi:MAG: hypothetical protein PHT25_11965 [Bacteroidales bacterium]|nr:hypothetical protein [Bacteroidales bacterium]